MRICPMPIAECGVWRSSLRRGFTLLEVILAVTLAVGFVGVMFGVYFQGTKIRERSSERMDLLLAERLVMERLTAELRCAMEYPFLKIGLEGDGTSMTFTTTHLPGFAAWADRGALDDPPPVVSDVQLVGYRLRTEARADGGEMVSGLERTVQRVLMSDTVEEAEVEEDAEADEEAREEAVVSVMLVTRKIRHLRLRYWDGAQWVEQWTGGDLPGAVEVTLGDRPMTEDEAEYPGRLFRRVIDLPGGFRAAVGSRLRGLGGGL